MDGDGVCVRMVVVFLKFVSAFCHASSLYMVVISVHSERVIIKLYAYIAVRVWSFPPDRLS